MIKIIGICAISTALAGCMQSASAKETKAKQANSNASNTSEFPVTLIHPIAFARYALAENISHLGQQYDSTSCQISSSFVSPNPHGLKDKVDLCAPLPKLASEDVASPKNKQGWHLPQTPESFIWQQNLREDQNLVVEIVDSDGLPWPTSSVNLQKNNQVTVKLTPSHELPKARELFLVGTIFDQENKKIETWLEPFTINEGADGKAPWASVSAPAKIVSGTPKRK